MVRTMFPLLAMTLVASVPALASETISVPSFDSVQLRGGGDLTIVPGPCSG